MQNNSSQAWAQQYAHTQQPQAHGRTPSGTYDEYNAGYYNNNQYVPPSQGVRLDTAARLCALNLFKRSATEYGTHTTYSAQLMYRQQYNRRTSNPKTATPPTYPRDAFPNSAPPQVASHQQHGAMPQTAQPYSYYPTGYYDQQYYMQQPRGASGTPVMDYDRSYQHRQQQQYYNPQQQWQQQQWQQGYYQQPVTAPLPQQPTAIPPTLTSAVADPSPALSAALPPAKGAAATATSPPAKKGKKEKKEKEEKPEKKDLKRKSSDEEGEPHEGKDGKEKTKKKKKEKEEKEKPPPKMKSKLHPPRQAQSAWQLFFTDELNKAKAIAAANQPSSPGGTLLPIKLNVAQIAKDAGLAYGNLNDEQKAYYAQKVQESKDQYVILRAEWEKTLTPEDIRAENAFRAQQRKEGKSRKGNLKDPNAPKKPLSAYFLFLKGIREDDTLRAKVWGEETETTKQSVLAAERWRALNDEEKKPYLAQAEKDKADYEEARKLYESDAAAKARGEDIPDRVMIDVSQSHVDPPASLLKSEIGPGGISSVSVDVKSPFDQFTTFTDPLDGLDMSMPDGQPGQWDGLGDLGSIGGMSASALDQLVSAGNAGQSKSGQQQQSQPSSLPSLEQTLLAEPKKGDDFLSQ